MADHLEHLKTALADRYVVERELGAGGMATVYLARDLKHDRQVAVKVLRPELAAILGGERFFREIRITANLEHPHVLALHDSGEADGLLFYVMPYVKGESLRAKLNREMQLSVEEALQVTEAVAGAIDYAHRHDVIHRDIKPENILLHEGGAMVADFGIALAVEAAAGGRLTETGLSLGTPEYMSPEQATGDQRLDGRSDIYSLGAVLYEMLAGEPPHSGATSRSVIAKALTEKPTELRIVRDTVPEHVDAAAMKALSKVPADRFATAGQLADALQHPVTAAPVLPRRAASRALPAIAIAVLLAATALVLGWNPLQMVVGARDRPGAGERAWTIVADVDGSAGEETRRVVRGLVAAAIDESAILRTLPANQIRRGLALAGMPDSTTWLPLERAIELAVRGSIRTVIVPTVDVLDTTYVVTVRVVDADSGTVIAVGQGSSGGESQLITALDDAVRRIRRILEEQPRAIAATRQLRQVATPSFEAYRLFDRGRNLHQAGDIAGAMPLYLEALEYDPAFAAVMSNVGNAFEVRGFPDSARYWWEKALEHPERLSDQGKLTLEANTVSDHVCDGPRRELNERIFREFRRRLNAVAICLSIEGRFAEAVALIQELEAASPFGLSAANLYNMIIWLLPLGRHEEARGYAEQLRGDYALFLNAHIAAASTDWAVAESLAVALLRKPDVRPEYYYIEGSVILASAYAARGRIRSAIEALDRGARIFDRGVYGPCVEPRQARFILEAVTRRPAEFAVQPTPAFRTSIGHRRLAALWAAWGGDTVAAAPHLRSADGQQGIPETGIDADHAQRLLLRARFAALAGQPEEVVRLLEGVAAPTFVRGQYPPFGHLVRWTIADAYEQIGDFESAAGYISTLASYEGFGDCDLAYRGLTYSVAHRRLAVLYEKIGDVDRAQEHWRTFLDNFTDPDPELRWMLDEARVEIERLERSGE